MAPETYAVSIDVYLRELSNRIGEFARGQIVNKGMLGFLFITEIKVGPGSREEECGHALYNMRQRTRETS